VGGRAQLYVSGGAACQDHTPTHPALPCRIRAPTQPAPGPEDRHRGLNRLPQPLCHRYKRFHPQRHGCASLQALQCTLWSFGVGAWAASGRTTLVPRHKAIACSESFSAAADILARPMHRVCACSPRRPRRRRCLVRELLTSYMNFVVDASNGVLGSFGIYSRSFSSVDVVVHAFSGSGPRRDAGLMLSQQPLTGHLLT
jgi:hypothetical protein